MIKSSNLDTKWQSEKGQSKKIEASNFFFQPLLTKVDQAMTRCEKWIKTTSPEANPINYSGNNLKTYM
jgi:hypothetical protein